MKNHTDLIRKIAWSFHKFHYSLGVEWEDLLQEASIAYFEAMKTYDKTKGKPSTYLWYCISNRLHNYLKEQEKYKAIRCHKELCRIDDVEITHHPAQVANDFWESLTEEATVIANLILFTPRKYTCLTRIEVEQRITRIMTNLGWKENKIVSAIDCLKTACQ
jgi:RNA polymerase sigma factor (sigma-70 family)